MGGGAGIKITARVNSFALTTRCKSARCEVESWDALGYDDGMRNVRGDMLEAHAYFDLRKGDIAGIKARLGTTKIDTLTVSHFEVKTIIWRGYVRGKWQDRFPLALEGEAKFEYYGNLPISVVIEPRDRTQFDYFWQDVFEWAPEENLIVDGEVISIATQYEEIEHENQVNYGAKSSC